MAVTLGPNSPGAPAAPRATKVKEVAFIVDESGSMETCRQQVISGYNEFVGDLKREKELDIRFSLTLFDTEVRTVVKGELVREIRDMETNDYRPAGNTALYDALGATLNALETRLKGDTETPITVIVMTDGQENSSREFTREAIRTRIEGLQRQGNWTFVFMAADQDARAAGGAIGIPPANTLSYSSSATGQSISQTSDATLKHLRSGEKQSRSLYRPPRP